MTIPKVAADAVKFAISQGLNPLQYIPSTQSNLNPAPWSVVLPDGTSVTITPAANPAAQPALNPAPSTTVDIPASQPKPATTTQTTPTTDPATTQAIRDLIAADAARKAAEDAAAKSASDAVHMPSDLPKISDLTLPTTNPYTTHDFNINLPSSSGCVPLNITLPYMGALVLMPCDLVNSVVPMLNWMIIILGVLGGIMVWMRTDEEVA